MASETKLSHLYGGSNINSSDFKSGSFGPFFDGISTVRSSEKTRFDLHDLSCRDWLPETKVMPPPPL